MTTPVFVPPVIKPEDDLRVPHTESTSSKSGSKAPPNQGERKNVRRRRVQFTPMVRVNKVMHLNDYSNEEIDACYYTKSDFSRIKADLKLTVKLIQVGKLPEDTTDYCRRGTEYRTPEGARQRALNKEIARDVLLDEQDAQWESGIYDPDTLAMVYRNAARQCELDACKLGMQDEEVARALDVIDLPKQKDTDEKLQTGICTPLRVSKNVRLRRRSITAFAA